MRSFFDRAGPFVSLCALSGALLLAPRAEAEGILPTDANAEQKKQATDHFIAGRQALGAKDWERAVSELRASLEIVDSPNARLELARALRDSNNRGDAWVEYGRVIKSATKLAVKEARYAKTADAATSERGDIEPTLAFVTVTVANAPAGATLKVGGRSVPSEQWAAPIVASAGAVDVVVTDSYGKELARQTVNAPAGQRTPVSLDANATSPAPAGATALATNDDDKPGGAQEAKSSPDAADSSAFDKTKLRPFSYVAGGIGVAGLATFAIFGIMSNSTYSDLKSACPSSQGGCPPSKKDEVSSGQAQQTIANVGLVVGLAGLAAGGTLLVFSLTPKAPIANAAVVVGPGYLGVRGSL
jgi:hypothetical protein